MTPTTAKQARSDMWGPLFLQLLWAEESLLCFILCLLCLFMQSHQYNQSGLASYCLRNNFLFLISFFNLPCIYDFFKRITSVISLLQSEIFSNSDDFGFQTKSWCCPWENWSGAQFNTECKSHHLLQMCVKTVRSVILSDKRIKP